MAFNGTWQVYVQENYEEFLRAMPIPMPEDLIEMLKNEKPITEIQQNGDDFVVIYKTPRLSVTNSFTINKEGEITTTSGKKLKCTHRMEGGKIITPTDDFLHIRQIQGEEMIETITIGSSTFTKKSKKI